MSRSFSPRRLDTDAWKGWHKDALRLMGRTGVVVVALWGLCVVGLAFSPFFVRLSQGRSAPDGVGSQRGFATGVPEGAGRSAR